MRKMRGTRSRYHNGYFQCLTRGHPGASTSGYVYEHILVAELAMQREMPAGAVVHHINGDGLDNRPLNLVVCQDQSYHQLLHRRAKALAACGDPNALKCMRCGSYERQADMAVWGQGRPRSVHRNCNRKNQKRRHAMWRATLTAAITEDV